VRLPAIGTKGYFAKLAEKSCGILRQLLIALSEIAKRNTREFRNFKSWIVI
jgi:hypothetical protein